MAKNTHFSVGQILYLQNHHVRLYCQLIEHVVSRRLFWVRPLFLVETAIESESLITDLQDASDLLWPREFFQPALDTEVINYLTQLGEKSTKPSATSTIPTNQILNRFIQDFWSIQRS